MSGNTETHLTSEEQDVFTPCDHLLRMLLIKPLTL